MRLPKRSPVVVVLASIAWLAMSVPASAGDGSAKLGLPWAAGETWQLSSGIHSWAGDPTPESSLDFSGGSGNVRAAGPGTVHRDGRCGPNFVRIDHGGGWNTSYYHIERIVVEEGQHVERGDLLGEIGTGTACGGTTDGPHVHFTLWRFTDSFGFRTDQEASLIGVDMGGWTISSKGYREACFRRIRDGSTQCAPQGQIYNDGAVGSSSPSGGSSEQPAPTPAPEPGLPIPLPF